MRVHVHDGSGTSARRPGDHIGVGSEAERSFAGTGQRDGISALALNTGEVEGVGALSPGARGNLGEALHVGAEGGEPGKVVSGTFFFFFNFSFFSKWG